jgi:hypothetical protein
MKSPLRLTGALLLGGWIGLGCGTAAPQQSANSPAAPAGPMQMSITAQAPPSDDPQDPRPQLTAMVHLDIFLLEMPAGSVSENAEFWKRVDEQAVGVASADRLNRNGIRCGVAPRSESPYFSHFFDLQPHTAKRSTVAAVRESTIELELERDFDRQDLFFFNAQDRLEGRSYDQCRDKWALTFGPAPRQAGAVRFSLCPVVYDQKSQLRFTPLNQEYETPLADADRIYDVGLTADVPDDSFLVVAPSSDAARATSIGSHFLIQQDKTQKLEQVIVIVPTFLRLDGKPMRVRERLIK